MPELPRLVQRPTESVPRRQKGETFERERMEPVRRFRDKQCQDSGQTFVRGQPQLARFSEEIHRMCGVEKLEDCGGRHAAAKARAMSKQ